MPELDEVTRSEALALLDAHKGNPPTKTPWKLENSDPREDIYITVPGESLTLGTFYEKDQGGEVDAQYAVTAVNAHLRLVNTVLALWARLDAAANTKLSLMARLDAATTPKESGT